MQYEIKEGVVPKTPASDTRHGRVKYPFAKLSPAEPGKRGQFVEIEGVSEVKLALAAMRRYRRDHGGEFVYEKETNARGDVHKVRIWRTA